MDQIRDVIIIGAGPSGWTAALYLARASVKPLLFSGDLTGGQLMLTSEVENFPGFPKGILGPELMMAMQEQAKRFGTEVIEQKVTKVDFSTQPFKVWSGDQEYQAKAIIISTGAETVWLGVPGEREHIGSGVSSCANCDAAFFKEKSVFVVGGGDSAMEDTLALTKFAKEITIVHRRGEFKASKIMQERVLANPKVKVIWNSQVKEIKGEQKVQSIIIEDVNTHETKEMPADGVFVAVGHKPTTEIFTNQIQLDEKGYVVTRLALEKMSLDLASPKLDEHGFVSFPTLTSVEGVFAAGDCVDFRYKQAITAAGFGCMAALDAEKWLSSK